MATPFVWDGSLNPIIVQSVLYITEANASLDQINSVVTIEHNISIYEIIRHWIFMFTAYNFYSNCIPTRRTLMKHLSKDFQLILQIK